MIPFVFFRNMVKVSEETAIPQFEGLAEISVTVSGFFFPKTEFNAQRLSQNTFSKLIKFPPQYRSISGEVNQPSATLHQFAGADL